jgi:hypothetical protein
MFSLPGSSSELHTLDPHLFPCVWHVMALDREASPRFPTDKPKPCKRVYGQLVDQDKIAKTEPPIYVEFSLIF